jgi:PPOX class probable F420-dependent enzyme
MSGKNPAIISTLRNDGSIHSAVVWTGVEDGKPTLNSALGRAWPKNVERDPRVTLTVYDQSNPYEYVEVRGRVVDADTSEEADRHIDRLAKQYLDADSYPFRTDAEQRVKFTVEPERVRHQAQG